MKQDFMSEVGPFKMLYKIPACVSEVAWNGSYLFYIIEDNQEYKLVKCNGDTKRAGFGNQISARNHKFSGQVKITANNNRIFIVDDKKLSIFDENMDLL